MNFINQHLFFAGIFIAILSFVLDLIQFFQVRKMNLKIKEFAMMYYYKFKLHSTKVRDCELVLGWIPTGGKIELGDNELIENNTKIQLLPILLMTSVVIAILFLFHIDVKVFINYLIQFFDYVFSYSSERKERFIDLTFSLLNQYNKVAFISLVNISLIILVQINQLISSLLFKNKNTEKSFLPILFLLFGFLIFLKLIILIFSMFPVLKMISYSFSFFIAVILINVICYFLLRLILKR